MQALIKRLNKSVLEKRAVGNRAFTVVELLVAIAIVLVVATLVGAGVSHARWEALKSGSSNNLKQLFLATSLYSGQHDGRHPVLYGGRFTIHPESKQTAYIHYPGEEMQMFKDQILPFTKSNDVFYSPTDPFARKNREGNMSNHLISSYEMVGSIAAACRHQAKGQPCSPLFEKPAYFENDPAYWMKTMAEIEGKRMPQGFKVDQSIHGDWFNFIDFEGRAEWIDITTFVR